MMKQYKSIGQKFGKKFRRPEYFFNFRLPFSNTTKNDFKIQYNRDINVCNNTIMIYKTPPRLRIKSKLEIFDNLKRTQLLVLDINITGGCIS